MNREEIKQEITKKMSRLMGQEINYELEEKMAKEAKKFLESIRPEIPEHLIKRNITVDPCLTEEEKAQGKINFIIS